ncbi:MAG TPA: SDR family NAD(P)-dependent oxidoreductase [Acidimicrobiales bacterium]|nr:SDR family NAD(P)-dependent oxidoreductase [Acidimicrobiales bacterium]
MSATSGGGQRPVAVVTGGGGGIGRAVAEELGRTGYLVVTLDPLVAVDGGDQAPTPEPTTAERIVAAGGSARASAVSVTDRDAVRQLFAGLVDEHGRLDAVVNVAGITRPTGFARGSEDDWHAVLSVHLDGYLNVLGAALPLMAATSGGRILGVTSGSGWRQADAGAYACAKRAVAALTWQLAGQLPSGVVLNAMSPIAATRMVTAALGRARTPGAGPTPGAGTATTASGGLSLGSMPAPEEIGPMGAHLVAEAFSWCRGQVIFAGGSEAAVIDRPRLVEVVRTGGVADLPHLFDTWCSGALVHAEADQATSGGSNPRFPDLFDATGEAPPAPATNCAIVSDRAELRAAVATALDARGVTVEVLPIDTGPASFERAAAMVHSTVEGGRPLDALVVALDGGGPASAATTWERVLAEHSDLAVGIHTDAAWARAIAGHAKATDRPVRLVTLTDGRGSGGRSRAQASAQLARSARTATRDLVSAFAISVEAREPHRLGAVGELAAHLVCGSGIEGLSGAELVVGDGWVGLRRHPRPIGSVTYGGPDVPTWMDDALRDIVGGAGGDGSGA